MLEEHDRVVVADRGGQQSLGVIRVGRGHDLDARKMGIEPVE
jgi:hypothetical protein